MVGIHRRFCGDGKYVFGPFYKLPAELIHLCYLYAMKALVYSLKVWATSLAFGPIVYYVLRLIGEPYMRGHGGGVLRFIGSVFLYSFIFSLPCFVFLTISVAVVNYLDITMPARKLILTVIGILLTLLPFFFLEAGGHWGQWAIRYAESYGSLIVTCIWIYKLEPVEKL